MTQKIGNMQGKVFYYPAAVQRMDLYDPCHKQALIKEVEVINEMLGLTTTATKFKVREDEVEKGPSGTSTYSYWKFYSTTTSRIYRIDADVVPCKKWDPVAEMNDTVLGCFRMGGIIYSVTR